MAFRFLCAALVSLGFAVALSAQTKTGFIEKKFKNADGSESPYTIFVPKNYDAKKPGPAMLFLHGAGETKGGAKKPVEVGIGPAIKKREDKFPFLVVIPQSEKRTWMAGSDDAKRAMAIFDEVLKEYPSDPKKLYLTGLSMGGFGTWSNAAADPKKWAAIAPICGGVPAAKVEETAKALKDMPIWNFHGDADTAVKVDFSRTLVDALKKQGNIIRYTEYPKVGHNSWDQAYATEELYEWLLKQEKK
jgi:predicted peptidase